MICLPKLLDCTRNDPSDSLIESSFDPNRLAIGGANYIYLFSQLQLPRIFLWRLLAKNSTMAKFEMRRVCCQVRLDRREVFLLESGFPIVLPRAMPEEPG